MRAAFERAAVPAEEIAGQEVRREQALLFGDSGHAGQRRHGCAEEAWHVARQGSGLAVTWLGLAVEKENTLKHKRRIDPLRCGTLETGIFFCVF